MKSMFVLLVCFVGTTALANESGIYEQAYLDCIDYAHQAVSAEKEKACKAKADELVRNSGGQVVPPYKVPAGDVRIDSLKKITLSRDLVLSSVLVRNESRGNVYVAGKAGGKVTCYLTGSDIAISKFNLISQGSSSDTMTRYKVQPKKSIVLEFKTSRQGVVSMKPSCNGEPELCEGLPEYYLYRTVVEAHDKSGNQWKLTCSSQSSRPALASDVKIDGLKVK